MAHDISSMTRSVLSKDENLEEEQLKEAAYQLLSSQFLLREKNRHRRHFNVIVANQKYFQRLMEATNNRLLVAEDQGFIGITPENYTRRMSINETLILLTLRYLYDEEINNFNSNRNGSVDITVKDFGLKYQALTNRELPRNKSDFIALLEPFVRCGVLEQGKDEDHGDVWRLHLYPTIATLVNGEALKLIEIYMKDDGIETESVSDDENDTGLSDSLDEVHPIETSETEAQ